MSEPYRDPDGPIHAVLAAANTVAPRCHLPDGVSLVHARYQYPACVPEATATDVADLSDEVADLTPWSVQDAQGREVGIYWSGSPRGLDVRPAFIRNGVGAVPVTDPDRVQSLRDEMNNYARLDDAKRRTRRDVAGVIT